VSEQLDFAACREGLSGKWSLETVAGVVAAYPPHGVFHPQFARVAVDEALTGLQERGQPSPAEWLLARVRAYAASGKGKGPYAGRIETWMRGHGFDASPAAWDDPKPKGGSGGNTPGTGGTGALARAKADREAADSAWAGRDVAKELDRIKGGAKRH